MEDSIRAFHKRQKSLRRKHTRMARGYVTKLDKSGIIIQRPDRKAGGIALRFLLLLALAFIGFKSFLLAGLGADDYGTRVSQLELGNVFEQAGAWLMQVDPLTVKLADVLSPYLA